MKKEEWIAAYELRVRATVADLRNSARWHDRTEAAFVLAASIPFRTCMMRQWVAHPADRAGDMADLMTIATAAIADMIGNAIKHMVVNGVSPKTATEFVSALVSSDLEVLKDRVWDEADQPAAVSVRADGTVSEFDFRSMLKDGEGA